MDRRLSGGQLWFFKCYLDGPPLIFSPLLILCSGLVPARYIGSVWQGLNKIPNRPKTNCFLQSHWNKLLCFVWFIYWYNKISDITKKKSWSQGSCYTEFPLYINMWMNSFIYQYTSILIDFLKSKQLIISLELEVDGHISQSDQITCQNVRN